MTTVTQLLIKSLKNQLILKVISSAALKLVYREEEYNFMVYVIVPREKRFISSVNYPFTLSVVKTVDNKIVS